MTFRAGVGAALLAAVYLTVLPDYSYAQRGGRGGGDGPGAQRGGGNINRSRAPGVSRGGNSGVPRDWNRPNGNFSRQYFPPSRSPSGNQGGYTGRWPGDDRDDNRDRNDGNSNWQRWNSDWSNRSNAWNRNRGNWDRDDWNRRYDSSRGWYGGNSVYGRYNYGRGGFGYPYLGLYGPRYSYPNRGFYGDPRYRYGRYGSGWSVLPFILGGLTGFSPYSYWGYGYAPGYGRFGYGLGYGGYGVSAPSFQGNYYSQVPQATGNQPSDFMAQGAQAFRRGDFDAAVSSFRHALVDDPQNVGAMFLLAQALFQTAQYEEAAATLQFAMAQTPPDRWGLEVKNFRALYGDYSPYTAQLKALERDVKAAPDDPSRRFLLGYHYGFLGYPEQAIKQLEKLIVANDKDEAAQQLRGVFSGRPGRVAPAVRPSS